MEITVTKLIEQKDRTISLLSIEGSPYYFTLEDGANEVKVPGKTRIPAGRYEVVQRKEGNFYQKYRKQHGHRYSLQLANVPGFEFILIHIGNYIEDTRGCLLVGNYIAVDPANGMFITESTRTYKMLYTIIDTAYAKGEKVFITITR